MPSAPKTNAVTMAVVTGWCQNSHNILTADANRTATIKVELRAFAQPDMLSLPTAPLAKFGVVRFGRPT